MPPLAPGDVFTFQQNSNQRIVLIKRVGAYDETYPPDTPQSIIGWVIELWVKRHTDDPDANAIISPFVNPPVPTGLDTLGTPISPALGQFAYDLSPQQTMYAPGEYPGEFLFWTTPASYAAGDPPYERIPIVWKIVQAVDLPAGM